MIIDGAILAAGFGTRMASPVPKVESVVLGETLVSYPWRALLSLGPLLGEIHLVVRPEGFLKDPGLEDPAGRKPALVVQPLMDGTWGAVEAVATSPVFLSGKSSHLLVVNGDGPLLDEGLLAGFAAMGQAFPRDLCLATAELSNPRGYGRIIRDAAGGVVDIREESRASEEEKKIREVNAGIYLIPREILLSAVSRVPSDPVKNERFLTTLVSLVVREGGDVRTFPMTPECMLGVNTQEELAQVTALLRTRINRSHMEKGVTFWDPSRTDVGPRVSIGSGTVIMPQTVLEGKTRIGRSCRIGLGAHLTDTVVGDGVILKDYVVATEALLRDRSVAGPFAHLRPGTDLGEEAHLGNFVETKKTAVGARSKVNHLSYLGDAEVGTDTNVGAGTITCNYDGYDKFRTRIGSGVFIGSDTQLVAPVSVGDRSVIAAGSTVVSDLPEDALLIGRAPAEIRSGGGIRYHRRRKERPSSRSGQPSPNKKGQE